MAKSRTTVEKVDLPFLGFYDIEKIDEERREVYGYAATWTEDGQGEIITKAAVEFALDDYMKWANLREMHQPSAVGNVLKAEVDDHGLHIVAKVTDDRAWAKVVEKTYKGFSIGGRSKERIGNKITKMVMTEISLADRPVNAESVITLFKADMDLDATLPIPARALDPNAPDIQKNLGTYAISRLSDIIGALASFREFYVMEERVEGDTSRVPEMLTRSLGGLGRILRIIVKEEMDELVEDKPTDSDFNHGEDIQMAEMLTKDDVTKIVADALEMQSRSAASKENERLAKAEQDELNKKITTVLEDNKLMKAELATLKATPEAGKGTPGAVTTIAVTKEDENGGAKIAKAEDQDPIEMIKNAHRVGATLTTSGFVPFMR